MTAPITSEYRELMNKLAAFLDASFDGAGFALFVFTKGDEKRVNFISNVERASMLVAMKEFIARAKARFQEPGGRQ